MTTRHLRWQLIGVVLMIFLVGGCGTFAPTPEPPTATPTPVPPTPTPFTEVGDPERGREIFQNGGGVIGNTGCKGCHSLGDVKTAGPPLKGISELASDRVPELSAAEYLRQSIVDPGTYILEGYKDAMPHYYQDALNEEDIAALVAFLLTQ